jgi:hypothetical protein
MGENDLAGRKRRPGRQVEWGLKGMPAKHLPGTVARLLDHRVRGCLELAGALLAQ